MTPEKNRYEKHTDKRISEIRQRTLELGANPGAKVFKEWKEAFSTKKPYEKQKKEETKNGRGL